jgi:hypothetical protein
MPLARKSSDMDWRQTAVQAPFRFVGLVLGALYIAMLF